MQLVDYITRMSTSLINDKVSMARKMHVRWIDLEQTTSGTNNKPSNVNQHDVKSKELNKKPVNSDLYQAMFPIYHLSKLCGIFPVRYITQASGKYQGQLNIIDIIYSLCLLMCLIGAEIWCFWQDLKDGWENSSRLTSQNAVIITCGDVAGVMGLTSVSIVGSILRWKQMQAIIDKLVDCDEKLRIISPKKIRNYTIILTLCTLTYSITLSCLDVYIWNTETQLKTSNKGPINYIPLYFMYLIIVMMEIQYATITYNVGQRFSRLNESLKNMIKDSGITDQFKKDLGIDDIRGQGQLAVRHNVANNRALRKSKIIDCSITNDGKHFTNNISQLMTVHASLCDTVALINTAYGIVILVVTVTCLIHLIITPYFLIMEANGRREPFFLTIQVLYCIFHIWRLLIVVQPTYSVTIEGKRTAVLVSKLLSKKHNIEDKKQLEIFLLQLLHHPLVFSAYGLFTLDRTLVTSIAGAVTTYLVILIQFQKEEDTNLNDILKNTTQMLKNASTLTAGRLGLS